MQIPPDVKPSELTIQHFLSPSTKGSRTEMIALGSLNASVETWSGSDPSKVEACKTMLQAPPDQIRGYLKKQIRKIGSITNQVDYYAKLLCLYKLAQRSQCEEEIGAHRFDDIIVLTPTDDRAVFLSEEGGAGSITSMGSAVVMDPQPSPSTEKLKSLVGEKRFEDAVGQKKAKAIQEAAKKGQIHEVTPQEMGKINEKMKEYWLTLGVAFQATQQKTAEKQKESPTKMGMATVASEAADGILRDSNIAKGRGSSKDTDEPKKSSGPRQGGQKDEDAVRRREEEESYQKSRDIENEKKSMQKIRKKEQRKIDKEQEKKEIEMQEMGQE